MTEKPVEYRYSVHEDVDPIRIIIDLPGMDISSISPSVAVNKGAIKEIKTSSAELTSGRLGRVEVLMDKPSAYDVSVAGEKFSVIFNPNKDTKVASVASPVKKSVVAPKPATMKA